MIDILTGFPDDVVAFAAKGKVTRSDYADVVVPKVEETFARHEKNSMLFQNLARSFPEWIRAQRGRTSKSGSSISLVGRKSRS